MFSLSEIQIRIIKKKTETSLCCGSSWCRVRCTLTVYAAPSPTHFFCSSQPALHVPPASRHRSKTPLQNSTKYQSPPITASHGAAPTFGKRSSNPSPLTRLTGRGLPVTLVHRLHLPAGPGSPQRRLFQAAADGDLHLFKSTCTRRAPHLDSRPSLSFGVGR